MTCEFDRYQGLVDEYDDLCEEYFDCGDHAERSRCWFRMEDIRRIIRSTPWTFESGKNFGSLSSE